MTEAASHDAGRVLIVDDNQDLADVMAVWLRDAYDVAVAYTGEDALEILDEEVDVVLLDRRMPGMSGDAVLEHIRAEELGCRVVMVSAVTPEFDVIGMGFDDYVTKPIEQDEILGVVERMQTRESYEGIIEEQFRLIQAKRTLDEAKSHAELERHDEYQRLSEQIADLREQTDTVLDEFDADDFDAAFREL
jgi:DNA-binding response OmpR family regulator